jgi:hypothetical protein
MVILQAGHQNIQNNCDPSLRGGTGAPGEIDWTPQVCDKVVALLQSQGVQAAHEDANFNCAPNVGQDWEAVVAVHYQSDPPHESGFFVGVGSPDQDGNRDGSYNLMMALRQQYQAATGLTLRLNWDSDNITYYYLFERLSGPTPFALIECGTGAPGAPDHDLLWNQMDKVALGIANGILQFLGKPLISDAPPPPPPSPPPPPPQASAPPPAPDPATALQHIKNAEAELWAARKALGGA